MQIRLGRHSPLKTCSAFAANGIAFLVSRFTLQGKRTNDQNAAATGLKCLRLEEGICISCFPTAFQSPAAVLSDDSKPPQGSADVALVREDPPAARRSTRPTKRNDGGPRPVWLSQRLTDRLIYLMISSSPPPPPLPSSTALGEMFTNIRLRL